jgi:indole-3-glycerol phosphate synthase/phosphoribosylanthranilate isomerase
MLGLAAVQLHGDEDASHARTLARRLPTDCELWKAIRVDRRRPDCFEAADRLAFDNGLGGTGRTFDWSLVRDHPELPRALVAGGIGPHNAAAAGRLGAYAIDAGSKLDDAPGTKSPERVRALFDALRPSSRQELRACA